MGQGVGAAFSVGGIFGQVLHEAVVGGGEGVVGHRRKNVVEGVEAEADGGPHGAGDGVFWVIDRVEQLVDEGHFFARADPAVGAEGAEVVDRDDEDAG